MKSDISGSVATVIQAPIEKVWDALVNPDIIRQYLLGTNTRSDWKPGSPIIFEGEWEGKSYQDKGTIHEIKPNEILRYDYWSSMGKLEDRPENYMMVTFKLHKDDNDHTLLTLLQENIPDEESKNHSMANWQMVLGNLKRILEEHT
jgi:uncharacterized protein YndB with AHSA1/START domain